MVKNTKPIIFYLLFYLIVIIDRTKLSAKFFFSLYIYTYIYIYIYLYIYIYIYVCVCVIYNNIKRKSAQQCGASVYKLLKILSR